MRGRSRQYMTDIATRCSPSRMHASNPVMKRRMSARHLPQRTEELCSLQRQRGAEDLPAARGLQSCRDAAAASPRRARVARVDRSESVPDGIDLSGNTDDPLIPREWRGPLACRPYPAAASATAYRLVREQELPYVEAAEVMGISTHAVELHLIRALKALRGATGLVAQVAGK